MRRKDRDAYAGADVTLLRVFMNSIVVTPIDDPDREVVIGRSLLAFGSDKEIQNIDRNYGLPTEVRIVARQWVLNKEGLL